MTTTLQAVEPAEPNPVADAIAALTAAARQTRVRGAGTEQATVEPVDFGEIATYVLTAVAANLGGVEELLAGRPGSWEADYVRQIVHSTAGDDDAELLRYRTEPVRLPFDAEDVFYDFGLGDLYDDERETPSDYAHILENLKSRDVPMICANPDQKVERGGRLVYCAGAIARAYEALGGNVSYAGKPFQPIYDLALEIGSDMRGKPVAKDRVLAIGDGVGTDIAGASNVGIRSVFIASGVHVENGEDIGDAAARLFAKTAAQPIALMNAFVW